MQGYCKCRRHRRGLDCEGVGLDTRHKERRSVDSDCVYCLKWNGKRVTKARILSEIVLVSGGTFSCLPFASWE